MKYKIGNTVKTEFGIGEILFIDHDSIFPYLIGIKDVDGYSGYSGETWLKKEEIQKYVIDKGYENQCRWFEEYQLESIEEESKMEHKIKFKIGDKVQTRYGIGEVLDIDIDIEDNEYLVGIKGFYGHSGEFFLTKEARKKYVIDKGYENQCRWFHGNGLKLIKEEKKMNKYVELLMDDLNLEVGDEFEVERWENNPYHFDEDGIIRSKSGKKFKNHIANLLYGYKKIKKIEKLPILTEEEIGMLKGFKMLGYNYIVRNTHDILRIYDKMRQFDRTEWSNPPYYPNLRQCIDNSIFNTIEQDYAYTIDELLEYNQNKKGE